MRKLAKKVKIQKSSQGIHSQRVIKRPMILPACIDLIWPALVADAGGETHAAVRILVRGHGVNHVGAVNHHAIGEEAARVEAFGQHEIVAFASMPFPCHVTLFVVNL
jgi:hypothetical protein